MSNDYSALTSLATKMAGSGNDPMNEWNHFSQAERAAAAAQFSTLVASIQDKETLQRTGIVTPAYDPSATKTWMFGLSTTLGSSVTPTTSYKWNVDDDALGNADGAFYSVLTPLLGLTAGQRTITAISVRGSFLQSTHVYGYYVDIWREDATEYTLLETTGELTPEAGSGGTRTLNVTLPTPLSFTIEDGVTYHLGFRVRRTTASTGSPYFGTTTGMTFATSNFRFACKNSYWNGATIPKTTVANNCYVYTDTQSALINITYTSGNLVEQKIPTAAAGSYVLARPTGTQARVIKAESVVVADGQAMTLVLSDFNMTGVEVVLETTELDCGNTVAGQNDLICHANTINLPDIGGEGQEGKTFDLLFAIRPSSETVKTLDVIWQNRHLETALHSHAVKNAGVRGTRYAQTDNYRHFCATFSGTFSCGYLIVAITPQVLVGDSQCIQNNGTSLRAPNTSRWGGLPSALTKPRTWVLHGQSGQYLEYSTAAVWPAIFCSDTPGDADGIELIGLGCEWFFAGIGINDASHATTESDADVQELIANLMQALTAICEPILAAGEQVYLAGMPPYSSDANADQYEGKFSRWWNRALLGLALAWRVPFYNPWPDMVEPGTEDDTLPEFLAAYTADSGTHYSAAGGAIVVANMVAAIEAATIDLRDAWN